MVKGVDCAPPRQALGSGGALARAGAMQQPSRLAAASGVALALGASVAYCAWSSEFAPHPAPRLSVEPCCPKVS